jgi:2-polyprenyl-6-methoxyphenol hydroxylase-like FAD-dependent oxidoreductase
MSAEYQCLFGIASPVQALDVGDFDIGYDMDRSSLVIVGQTGRTYYFVFQKLDKVYRMGNIPLYTKAEAIEFAQRHADMKIRPDINLAHLWKNTLLFVLVALEEAKFKIWTWGRITCVGDSIHKMTPNLGSGGNASIESSAAFANVVKVMVDKGHGTHPTESQVKECLAGYQRSRERRASSVIDISNSVTRVQALKGIFERLTEWEGLRSLNWGGSLQRLSNTVHI